MATTPWTFKGVTDEERAQITRLARQHGVPIGRFVVACCLRADGEPITVAVAQATPDNGAPTETTERLERLIRLAGDTAVGTPAHRTAMRALSRLIRAETAAVVPRSHPVRAAPRLPAPEPAE